MTDGPTAPAARALGPDLARGFMLLFIALANSHYLLRGTSVLGGYPQGTSGLDRAVTWLLSTFVDGRAFPLFGLLFGYGVAQIVRRQQGRGPRGVRRLLWRRALVLIVVGLIDGILFYVGDILAAYGVLLLIGALLVRWKDRWLLVLAAAFFVLTALPSGDALVISNDSPDGAVLPPDFGAMFSERPAVVLYIALLGPVGFLCPYAIGLWAGRRRLLEQPERHRRLLTVVAVAGLGAAVLGAQPAALLLAGVTERPGQDALELMGALHTATGTLGGFGYAALLSLIAVRPAGRPARAPTSGQVAHTGRSGPVRHGTPAGQVAHTGRSGPERHGTPAGQVAHTGRSGPERHGTPVGKRQRQRRGVVVTAIAATGQRSMTCYLMQSVVWAVLFTPFLLDLSGTLSVAGTALVAAGTWAATVVAAEGMRRRGWRGPFEVLVRRVTYGGGQMSRSSTTGSS